MKRRRPKRDGRVMIGSGHRAGDLDLRDAGPIPEWAGIKVVEKKRARATKNATTKRDTK